MSYRKCKAMVPIPGSRTIQHLERCDARATSEGLCEYHGPGPIEAAANVERIRRAARGLPQVGVRVKPSNIVAYGESLNDPDARYHNSEGFPVFSSLSELRNYAKKKEITEGRRMRIDPDGGVPTSADKRKEAEAWRDRRAKRKERVKKQGDLSKRLVKAIGRTE